MPSKLPFKGRKGKLEFIARVRPGPDDTDTAAGIPASPDAVAEEGEPTALEQPPPPAPAVPSAGAGNPAPLPPPAAKPKQTKPAQCASKPVETETPPVTFRKRF